MTNFHKIKEKKNILYPASYSKCLYVFALCTIFDYGNDIRQILFAQKVDFLYMAETTQNATMAFLPKPENKNYKKANVFILLAMSRVPNWRSDVLATGVGAFLTK